MQDFTFIRLKCVGCPCHLRVPAEYAGKQVRCPDANCSAISQIPGRHALNALTDAGRLTFSEPPMPMEATATETAPPL
ncbi:MAG: hypothetical protein VYA30_00845 [Myxococcota bacterium]|nr:hypothetical protein [Myxococcota bacterium]